MFCACALCTGLLLAMHRAGYWAKGTSGLTQNTAYALTWSFRNHLVISERLGPGIWRQHVRQLEETWNDSIPGPHWMGSGEHLKAERQIKPRVKRMGMTGRGKQNKYA